MRRLAMRISHRYKFVFFANPKAGSSTVRQFLNPYSDIASVKNIYAMSDVNPFHPHMRPEEARLIFKDLGWDFYGYTKFVIVRNPWARLVSLYEHIKRFNPETDDFKTWLYTIKPYGSGGGFEKEPWRRYGAYSIEAYIKDEVGNVLVDKVFRLEDLKTTLVPFLVALGLPIEPDAEVPIKNQNPRKRLNRAHYKPYYTPNMRDYVHDIYRYDIVNYGYTFDN